MRWDDEIWFDRQKSQAIRALMNQGWRIEDGKLKEPTKSLNFDTPWIFVEDALQPFCGLWNHVYFQRFGLIPRFCRTRCHKVVVKMQYVNQLFQLHHLMMQLGYPGKLGIDRRDYTAARYAAFFYTDSPEEGQERYDQVKTAIQANLPEPDTYNIILKKGCTEMENPVMGGKPTTEWGDPTPADDEMEDRLTMIFDHAQMTTSQPAWLKNHVMYAWLEHAYGIGDPTWAAISNDIFGVHYETYHKDQTED